MYKNEILNYLTDRAATYNTEKRYVSNAKYCVERLNTGETKLFVWERERVDSCGSVHYCADPRNFGLLEITKVTKVGRGMYNMEVIPVEDIKTGVTYK